MDRVTVNSQYRTGCGGWGRIQVDRRMNEGDCNIVQGMKIHVALNLFDFFSSVEHKIKYPEKCLSALRKIQLSLFSELNKIKETAMKLV